MKLKKFTSVLLVMCAVTTVGCSSNSNQETAASSKPSSVANKTESQATATEESNYTAPGEMPIVKEPITLRVLAEQDGEFSRADNLQTKELEEMTNIKIEWVIAPSGSIKEKLNLMFASGDMVDLVMLGPGNANRLDKTTEASFGVQNLIIPLNEYYDTVSVGYKEAFEKLEGMRDYITAPDGNIYTLPNVDGSLHVQYNCKLWLNTQWLDNLGLKMPTTTDEFYNVMKAFKEQDANGNGDSNDEIPLSTVTSGAGTQMDGFLMNPFQLTPDTNKMYLEDGKVVFSPVQDDYKEGLKYLNKLYSEGLINPESFTQDKDNQVNVNENGEEPVIGAFLALHPAYACDLSTKPYSTKWQQYQPLAPLKGPDGEAIAAWNPYVMYQTGMTFITSACKEPEAAFRLIDYLATHEGSYREAFGVEGVHYRKAETGEVGLDGKQSIITLLPDGQPSENFKWNQLAGLVRYEEDTVGVTTNPDPYAEGVIPTDGRQVVMYKGSLEHEKVRQPLESVLPDLYQSPEDTEETALLKTTIMDYTNESLVRFITGDMDIDKEWDSYKKQLESLGLPRYLELIQNAYDNSSFAK